MAVWHQLALGYRHLWAAPAVYIAVGLLVLLQYTRASRLEKASFGLRITAPVRTWLVSMGAGIAAALAATAALYMLSVRVTVYEVTVLWIIMAVLWLIDVRFSCIAYAAPLLIVGGEALRMAANPATMLGMFAPLGSIHAASLLILCGVAQLSEGVLTQLLGARDPAPLFVQSRRGQVVGAFVLQKFWPLPLLVSTASGMIVPFPLLVGFSKLALGSVPERSARAVPPLLLIHGALAAAAGLLLRGHPVGLAVAAALTLLSHGALYAFANHTETAAMPLFARPQRGVRILATLAGSPAEKMALKPGETIVRIGGAAVNSSYDIHFAIDQNPAYAKLEVVDLRGETRFEGTPLYTDDPHQLGVVIVPDEHAREYAQVFQLSVGSWLWRWWLPRRRVVASGNPAHAPAMKNLGGSSATNLGGNPATGP
ncbi:MAG: hypothetical protein ACYCVB_17760 [Bacilli bacterium]